MVLEICDFHYKPTHPGQNREAIWNELKDVLNTRVSGVELIDFN